MKLTLKVAFIFAVLLIAGVILDRMERSPTPEELSNVEIDLSPEAEATQTCYIWNTEAGDRAMISMDIRNDNVIGEFYWLPFAKDSKTGIFKGTVSSPDLLTLNRTIDALWEASGEGVTNNEELRIVFGEGIASPGFGEMALEGSVYRYAEPKNISYPINLQQTDCGDEAMD
jgi:hypothetical protein